MKQKITADDYINYMSRKLSIYQNRGLIIEYDDLFLFDYVSFYFIMLVYFIKINVSFYLIMLVYFIKINERDIYG